LGLTGSINPSDGGGGIVNITIVSVPRGCQYNPNTGMIVYPSGVECDPPPFVPFSPTPDFPELSAPMPAEPEPIEVVEPVPNDKVAVLDAHRRRREPSGAV
jgi:hypothetical protein